MRYKINIKYVTFLLIILFAVTCTEDEMPTKQFPSVRTLEVSNINNSGAQFNAKILQQGNQEIVEYGFVWGQEENPTIELNEKRTIANKITTGGFSAQIETTLKEDKKYYARAYAKNDRYLVYGINVTFLSLGSGAATIDDFYPKLGTWGDTITLVGKNFSYLNDHNHVLFKDIVSNVTNSTDSTITCVVPDNILDKSATIYVNVANQLAEAKNDFELTVPEIEVFSPLKGTFGDTINFIGKNFSAINNRNIISFNGHQGEVITSTKTTLSVIVPTSVNTHRSIIKITLSLKSDSAEDLFEVLAPKVYGVSPESGSSNTLIKITGDNFNPNKLGDTINLDVNFGEVIEASKKELTVKIPFGAYTNRSFKVGVTVAAQTDYDTSIFTIEEPWIKRGNVPVDVVNRLKATSFTLLNSGYVGLGSQLGYNSDVYNKDFYKYDPIQNSWLQVSDFPGAGIVQAANFVIGNYAYVGTGINSLEETNEFWRYDPTFDVWTQIESFPYSISGVKGLSVNGKGYIFIDTQGDNFWSYNPSIDKWFKMPALDMSTVGGGDSSPTKGFVIEGKIYIGITRNKNYTHIFEYDTNTQQWTKKSGLNYSGPYGNYMGAGFSIDNIGYIMGAKSLFQYDPLSDSWEELSNFPIVDYYFYPTSFVLDGKAYYGTGNPEPYFWEYDPNYE